VIRFLHIYSTCPHLQEADLEKKLVVAWGNLCDHSEKLIALLKN